MLEPQSPGLFLLLMVVFVGFVWWMVVARQVVFRVLAACLAFVPAMLFGVAAVNKYYDYYQSWGAVVADFTNQTPNVSKPILIPNMTSTKFSKILGGLVNNASARQSGYTVQLTITGAQTQIKRTVYIYLPPQYFQKAYANYRFPAIELFPGYPGEPQDWINVMGITSTLNTLVRDNLARPAVLVMPDTEGQLRRDLECLNLPNGGIQDATYLAEDVPDYVFRTVRVQPPGAGWGLAGYSEGGFCAANLAIRYRKLFGFAGVMSGYFSPLPVLVGRPARYESPFLHDHALQEANTPMDALPLVPSWAFLPKFWIGAGSGDREDVLQADAFQQLLLQRQPKVKVVLAPGGGHTMFTWRDLVTPMLEWMTPQLAAEASLKPVPPGDLPSVCPACQKGNGPGSTPVKSGSPGVHSGLGRPPAADLCPRCGRFV